MCVHMRRVMQRHAPVAVSLVVIALAHHHTLFLHEVVHQHHGRVVVVRQRVEVEALTVEQRHQVEPFPCHVARQQRLRTM